VIVARMPQTGSASEVANELALLIADVYELAGALRDAGEQLAAAASQTQARWQQLTVISDGTWTVPQAARRLGVSRQAVQRVADLLVADGLARYDTNPGHRRSPHVRLTDHGEQALAAITETSAEWRQRVAEGLSAPELREIRARLEQISAGVRRAQVD
jgi:DNA-binding MarR family transcriptional regulator